MPNYIVYSRKNELGKLESKGKIFASLNDAKKYCESIYKNLGDAIFYDTSLDNFQMMFTRSLSVSDNLVVIEKY